MAIALLIDDDPDDIQILTESIEEFDATIICHPYVDSLEAIAWLKLEPIVVPDYIFIDINMPKLDGVECLRIIRAKRHLDSSVVTILSTGMTLEMQSKVMALGANFAFRKPYNFAGYLRLVRSVFQSESASF